MPNPTEAINQIDSESILNAIRSSSDSEALLRLAAVIEERLKQLEQSEVGHPERTAFSKSVKEVLTGGPFPISLSELFQRYKAQGIFMTPVDDKSFYGGRLAPDEAGKYYLVDDPSTNQIYLFPKATSLSSSEAYHYYYEDYFDCDDLRRGDITIDQPAIVSEEGHPGTWECTKKGKISMK